MKTDQYGAFVRVRFEDQGYPVNEDIVVERKVGSDWIRVAALNSVTNDYAYTEARRIAERTQRQMAALGFGA